MLPSRHSLAPGERIKHTLSKEKSLRTVKQLAIICHYIQGEEKNKIRNLNGKILLT